MKQQSLGLGQSNKRTRRREFLSEMERVVPWSALVALVSSYMPDARSDVQWNIAMRPGKRRQLDKADPIERITEELEHIKARIRAKVEHPFRVIKRQFGHVKVRYRGLVKNTAQLHTLFALANLWMARRRLQGAGA